MIHDFLFFMFDKWTEDTCNELYGDLGPHIWNKWLCAESLGSHAIWYFLTSLDDKCQSILLEAAKSHCK